MIVLSRSRVNASFLGSESIASPGVDTGAGTSLVVHRGISSSLLKGRILVDGYFDERSVDRGRIDSRFGDTLDPNMLLGRLFDSCLGHDDRSIGVVGASVLRMPELLKEGRVLLPSGVGNSRSLQESGLKDLSVLTTISNVVLSSGARGTSDLGDRAKIDSVGRDDAGDDTASAEEADAGAARKITDDAVVGDHVELAASEGHLGRAQRSALRDGDGLNTHSVVE